MFLIAELALVVGLHVPSYVPWVIISGMGAGTVLSYSILNQYFPKEIAGQAKGMSRLFVEHCEAVAAKINITRRWLGEQ
jgi:hypothetical protein